MGSVNFHIVWEKYGEKTGSALPHVELLGAMPVPISGNAQILPHGNILWKAISLSGCEFLRKLTAFRKPKQSPKFES